MTTTHSEPQTPEPKPRRGLGDLSVLAALALAPLAFVAGGFAAALALPGVFVARLRPAAFALFAGVAVCFGLSLAGVNPWADYARERVLDEIEAALGARPEYSAWAFDVTAGRMRFDNLSVNVPQMSGSAQVVGLTVETGFGFFWRRESPAISGRGLTFRFDGASARTQEFLARLDGQRGADLALDFESVQVKVQGEAVSADLLIDRVVGASSAGGFDVSIKPARIDLTVWEQTHVVNTMGTVNYRRREGVSRMSFDVKAADSDVLMAYLQGTLSPEAGPEGLVLGIDWLNLGPLWARYRKIDVYGGALRGKVPIWGTLDELRLGLSLDVNDYSYFHRVAMALDESRAFRLPQGRLTGELRLVEGAKVMVHELKLEAPDATLCTDPEFNARGGGHVTLSGEWPTLNGRLEAVVESGAINKPISWSASSTSSVRELQPNIVKLAEQFSRLELDWQVEVKRLDVQCQPLQGVLQGRIEGKLSKTGESGGAGIRAGGKLSLVEGAFAFCGASGSAGGTIEFNPNAPSYHASIRGTLNGSVGETPLQAEITGSLSDPGLVFTGMTMSPEDLGRKIATWSAEPMDAAARRRRNEAIVALCGTSAAMNGNPFIASGGGKVYFGFRP